MTVESGVWLVALVSNCLENTGADILLFLCLQISVNSRNEGVTQQILLCTAVSDLQLPQFSIQNKHKLSQIISSQGPGAPLMYHCVTIYMNKSIVTGPFLKSLNVNDYNIYYYIMNE